ncbi:elongation factor G [Plantactinospora soyae]|uniref:Ribosomal protection tetracycline resistance protein n=1 Tax=Plantactinospora soyae TaxID=1544732 RepID=A0A927R9J0_9ACTN|nr:TetM/TetW/TetO/TetS family tetracycline resistance ribosomal protection protein [Plantactinospora soyae]MBE1491489.1 ribosomal protection tetracycline resistance protein [Plantactinospora soyae]
MPRKTLNLGILAHVDAGKTTLTERLLYAAGVIDTVGTVDAGTTRTDTLALERQRGITIKSAVVSFEIAGATVNLIDTPGHPDFIAEVERVLSLLDGAVLVISAVEGVQPQTRVLMRALRRLRIPTLLFVNKIDRGGADVGRVIEAIRRRLPGAIIPMGTVDGPGTRAARFRPYGFDDPTFRAALTEVLAERDDSLLAAYVEDESAVTDGRLRGELAAQSRRSLLHPVFFGAATTGEGVPALMTGLAELLPAEAGDPEAEMSGRVFKIDRGSAGEKVAYVRMFGGTVQIRQRLRLGTATSGDAEAKATGISVPEHGGWVRRPHLVAGEIGRLWGLNGVRIGDTIGQPPPSGDLQHFAPPTMETVVVPVRPGDGGALRGALARLAEQDPLINVRSDDTGREISVSLYGEVQKEVIGATLATDFGIDVTFRETTIICVERPVGRGEAVEILNTESNPFQATIGLRVEPGPPDSGIEFRMRVEPQAMPMYVYRNADTFTEHMARYVRRTLCEGRFGWQVTDCVITMIDCSYSLADGPPSTRGPLSTPADFRNLTPLVLMRAVEEAGTVVCEPMLRMSLEIPVWSISAVLTALGRIGAAVKHQSLRGDLTTIEAVAPAARVPDLQRRLPGLTAGEGVVESTLDGYRPVRGEFTGRPRTTVDPRNRERYLLSLTRQGARG